MPRAVVLDEVRLTILLPPGLGAAAARAMKRALGRPAFLPGLRCALRAFLDRRPALRKARLAVAR
jgi:hypothetical protein